MNVMVSLHTDADTTLTAADKFYFKGGRQPCCAGCDWWNTDEAGFLGECTKTAPVAAKERYVMLSWVNRSSLPLEHDAGHILTRRDHKCGDFKDNFDWGGI